MSDKKKACCVNCESSWVDDAHFLHCGNITGLLTRCDDICSRYKGDGVIVADFTKDEYDFVIKAITAYYKSNIPELGKSVVEKCKLLRSA
ncbi:MAG: hypothetical protein SPI34_00985 [Opitutales bacterium]|nr:hypothetical protein [Opitutales bacterium]